MDISNILARVNTAAGLVSVVEGTLGGFEVPVDSSKEVYDLLAPLVGGNVYPVTMKERATYPSIVYTLVGVDPLEVDGYRVTQTDNYIVEIRTTSYDELISIRDSSIAAFRTSQYSIEPVDMLHAYDDERERFHAQIEISVTYPVTAGGGPAGSFSASLPMAIVYPIDRYAFSNEADNYVNQRMNNRYGIAVLAESDIHVVLDAIQDALLGYQQSDLHDAVHYESGSNLGGWGGLEVWREIYSDWYFIQDH